MKAYLVILLMLLVSCATRTPVTDKLTRKTILPKKAKITNVPVIKQEDKQCGPASLAMILQHHGIHKSRGELSKDLFQKDLGGSFRSDIMASARREGMMAMEINDLSKVVEEVNAGNPVLVFQNLGFSFLPQWHFSVLTGYNLRGPDVILNSGKDHEEEMDMRLFERSWVLGGKWGAVILPPGKLAKTIDEMSHVEAASLLEKAGLTEAAGKSYNAILSRWPESHLALIGAANISYSLKQKKKAEEYLLRATLADSQSSIAWHNLALVQDELGNKKKAKLSAKKAMETVQKENESQFKVSLKKFLSH